MHQVVRAVNSNAKHISKPHALLTAVCAACLLAGCTREKEDGRVEIVFNDHPYAHWIKVNKELIAEFEAANPDVRVKFVPGSEDKLLAMVAGGVPPDVWTTDHVRLPYFARRDLLKK